MAVDKITNNSSKGLLRNGNALIQDKEYYTFALNTSVSKNITDRVTKSTENKLTDFLQLEEDPYIILGSTWLGKDEYVYFTKNKNNDNNNIWLVNNKNKTLKYSNINLNFQFNKLITTTYRVDYKGDRLIYFVDGFNKDRVINIDKIQLTDNVKSLDLVPYYGASNDIDLSVVNSGKLLQGQYTVAISFKDINNIETNIKSISNSVSIGAGNYFENRFTNYSGNTQYFNAESTSFLEVNGLDNDVQTFKSIKISIRDLIIDNYVSMNVYIIRSTAETTEVKLLEDFKLRNNFIITGSENFTVIGNDISSIIINNILYNQSEVITQKDNRLIRANTKIDSFNQKFQEFANTITVNYTVDTDRSMAGITKDRISYDRPRIIGNKGFNDYTQTILLQTSSPDYLANNNDKLNKTFSRDEVYALGVYFELEGGTLTDVYHIPGRLPNIGMSGGNETLGVPVYAGNSNESDFDTKVFNYGTPSIPTPRWKIANTAVLLNSTSGLLGYYRTDETYPDGYGFPINGEQDVNGKSYIRHHKIPSELLVPLVNTYVDRTGSISVFASDKNYIGLKFNYSIPSEFQNIIKKVYFTYSSKNDDNKNVLGKGISYTLNSNRQSDQLNRYASSVDNGNAYEFYSAESLFKFKQSNINAKRIKTTSILQGVVRYITKIMSDEFLANSSLIPQYASFLNVEGANLKGTGDGAKIESYNYKQLVRTDNVFYNKRITLSNQDSSLLKLNTIKFVDKNSINTDSGNTINLEGGQNSVFYTIENSSNSSYLSLDVVKYNAEMQADSDKMSKLMVNYPLPESPNWNSLQSLLETQTYYDSVGFSTLLSDNPNIHSDLINLNYEISYTKNNTLIGDCYLDVLHGKRSYTGIMQSSYKAYAPQSNKEFVIAYKNGDNIEPSREDYIDTLSYNDYFAFFTESQLNIRMRTFTSERNYYPYNTLTTSNLANLFEKQTNTEEYYYIDEGYNKNNITTYNANSVKLEDEIINQRRLETRMVYSELQNNESKIDNYRTALANNYKDLITTKGGIYQMFTKQEKLYALTRDSLFMVNTSNQSLKTDSSYNITVGTGEFFGIEPSEVVSIDGGIGGTSSKLSLNENPYGYLYVDRFKNKIMLFNNSLEDINTFGLQEFFKLELDVLEGFISELDNPQLGYGISTGYDPILHRFLITKKDYKPLPIVLNNYKGVFKSGTLYLESDYFSIKGYLYNGNGFQIDFDNSELFENKSITVSFDPITKTWISYHTYFPYKYIQHSNYIRPVINNITSFNDLKFADKQILELVFNENMYMVKVFDSLELDIRSEDNQGNTTNDCFTDFIAYNEKQSTGLVSLNSKNLTKKETYWNINTLRDDSVDYSIEKLFTSDWNIIKNDYYIDKVVNPSSIDLNKLWYKRGRLRDKYLIVRFIRNNLDNKKIICNFVNSNIRTSNR